MPQLRSADAARWGRLRACCYVTDHRPKSQARSAILACLLSLLFATAAVAQAPAAPGEGARRPTVVGLPVPQITQTGELVVRPRVAPANSQISANDPFAAAANGPTNYDIQPASAWQPIADPSDLPPPQSTNPYSPSWPETLPDPSSPSGSRLGDFLGGNPTDVLVDGEPLLPWDEMDSYWRHHWSHRQISPTGEAGIGRERVAYAPFEIDITQPQGNFTWRTLSAYNLGFPDRSEYFWSRPGKGPAPEQGVDFQEFRFLMEMGSGSFSLGTEVPIRLLNPIVNGNNNGVGDIQLIQKTVLINGSRFQMTQLLRTTFNNGNSRKGLGSGHVAMEPGMLFRWHYNDLTYYHSELKLSFPIGGDPMAAAPLLKWGIGVSTVWYETDTTAYLPTLEFTNLWFLDGLKTFPDGSFVDVEADGVFLLTPGLRTVYDTGGDLGVVEFGYSFPVQIGNNGWYDFSFRFDLRFVY